MFSNQSELGLQLISLTYPINVLMFHFLNKLFSRSEGGIAQEKLLEGSNNKQHKSVSINKQKLSMKFFTLLCFISLPIKLVFPSQLLLLLPFHCIHNNHNKCCVMDSKYNCIKLLLVLSTCINAFTFCISNVLKQT